ncbi:hypothetical protein XENTR_v10001619 [Xenopus tropicalis]|nr:hypothetical protein XENTR_v10001619 [Xenopus tropicalis]
MNFILLRVRILSFCLNFVAEPNVPLSVPDRLSASGPIMESQGQKVLEAECEEPAEGIIESIPAPSSPCQPIEDTRFEQ